MKNAQYGRRECVTELAAAVIGLAAGQSTGTMVTARQAGNAQRVLDGLLASNGEWTNISYV